MTVKDQEKRWYVLYTKPRWEKKVHALLERRGFSCYCPLNRVHRVWSDRIKLVEEPLFKSYVFVQLAEGEQPQVRYVDGVVNFVYWLGKPAIVRDGDIDKIRRFLNEHEDVELERGSYLPDTMVVIQAGPFMDRRARVIRDDRKRVFVEIESLGCALRASVPKNSIQAELTRPAL